MTVRYPVTREHYEKYSSLAKAAAIRFNGMSYKLFGFQAYRDLTTYQRGDPGLTNLSPSLFLPWATSVRTYNALLRERGYHELVCLAKHCLLAHTLEATPKFITKMEAPL